MTFLKSKYAIYILLMVAVVITSCSKSTSPKPTPKPDSTETGPNLTPVWPTDADVYFTGTSQDTHGTEIATYWKNGVATTLSSSGSSANGIAVNGTDVYVAGTDQVATLWKNGVPTKPAGTSAESQANAITISSNNIYIGGEIDGKATYWENGVAISVNANQLLGSVANAIAVSGNDVYLAGYTFNVTTGAMQAAYWKNGVLTQLSPAPLPGATTQATGIAVSGTDVYITGFTNEGATLWKNGAASALSNESASLANAIIINGSDIYVSGFNKGYEAYWKNGVMTNLPANSSNLLYASYIALDGNDVYVAGGLSVSPNGSIYWRNGIAYLYSNGLNQIKGIIVVPH